MFTVEIEDEADFVRSWHAAAAQVYMGAARGVRFGIKEGADEARTKHRFRNRTGRLERSIDGNLLETTANGANGVIVSKAPYASFVEGGTQPHIIRARKANRLAFVDLTGRLRFARIVRHPGSRPMPFMALAYFKAEAVIIRELERGVAAAQALLDQ